MREVALKQSIQKFFDDSQRSIQSHNRLIKSLSKIYEQTVDSEESFNRFWNEFSSFLSIPLTIFKREPQVRRVLEFVAKFVVALAKCSPKTQKGGNEGEGDAENTLIEESADGDLEQGDTRLMTKLFDFLLTAHKARSKAVRFRCCELVHLLLDTMGPEANLEESLCDRIYECMLERMRDRVPLVRVYAILSLKRLQCPQDENCQVMKAYMFLLRNDPNAEVRGQALRCLVPTRKTLFSIIERTRDVNENIRRLAYQILSEKVHVKSLSIKNRMKILKDGLRDRSSSVKNTIGSRVLQSWIKYLKGDFVALVRAFDFEGNGEICQESLELVLESLPMNEAVDGFISDTHFDAEKKLLPDVTIMANGENSNEETMSTFSSMCFYWKCLGHYLKKQDNDRADELLDKILPTGLDLVAYIRTFASRLKRNMDFDHQLSLEFIIIQLLELASLLDLTDEVGRNHLRELVDWMLQSEDVSEALVQPLFAHLIKLIPSERDRILHVAEIISELREPSDMVQENTTVAVSTSMNNNVTGANDLSSTAIDKSNPTNELSSSVPSASEHIGELGEKQDEMEGSATAEEKEDQTKLATMSNEGIPPVTPKQMTAPMTDAERRSLEMKDADIRVEMCILRDELDDAVKGKNFQLALELQTKMTTLERAKADISLALNPPTPIIVDPVEPSIVENDGDVTMTEPTTGQTSTLITSATVIKRNDFQTLLKCLTLLCEALAESFTLVGETDPTIASLIESLVLFCISNEHPAVRKLAVRALGLTCYNKSRELARHHMFILLQISKIDKEQVQIQALKVIMDLLVLYGIEPFDSDGKEEETTNELTQNEKSDISDALNDRTNTLDVGDDGANFDNNNTDTKFAATPRKTASSILSILTRLLDCEGGDIQAAIALGLGKLFIHNRLQSPQILCRLILLWYNPVSEGNIRLRSILGTFFDVYAFASPSNQRCIGEAFMPAMKELFQAPGTSPLSSVDTANVAQFLVELTNPLHCRDPANEGGLSDTADSIHCMIAEQCCNEILSDPNSFATRTLCRTLTLLHLSTDDELRPLKLIADEVKDVVKEYQCSRWIKKFIEKLDEVLHQQALQNAPLAVNDTTNVDDGAKGNDDAMKEETFNAAEVASENLATPSDEPIKPAKRQLLTANSTVLSTPLLGSPNDDACSPTVTDISANGVMGGTTDGQRRSRIDTDGDDSRRITPSNDRRRGHSAVGAKDDRSTEVEPSKRSKSLTNDKKDAIVENKVISKKLELALSRLSESSEKSNSAGDVAAAEQVIIENVSSEEDSDDQLIAEKISASAEKRKRLASATPGKINFVGENDDKSNNDTNRKNSRIASENLQDDDGEKFKETPSRRSSYRSNLRSEMAAHESIGKLTITASSTPVNHSSDANDSNEVTTEPVRRRSARRLRKEASSGNKKKMRKKKVINSSESDSDANPATDESEVSTKDDSPSTHVSTVRRSLRKAKSSTLSVTTYDNEREDNAITAVLSPIAEGKIHETVAPTATSSAEKAGGRQRATRGKKKENVVGSVNSDTSLSNGRSSSSVSFDEMLEDVPSNSSSTSSLSSQGSSDKIIRRGTRRSARLLNISTSSSTIASSRGDSSISSIDADVSRMDIGDDEDGGDKGENVAKLATTRKTTSSSRKLRAKPPKKTRRKR